MKAALYQGQGAIELTTLPDPKCMPEGAILENVYASICGTDVAVYKHGTGLGHKITVGGEFGEQVNHIVIVRIARQNSFATAAEKKRRVNYKF